MHLLAAWERLGALPVGWGGRDRLLYFFDKAQRGVDCLKWARNALGAAQVRHGVWLGKQRLQQWRAVFLEVVELGRIDQQAAANGEAQASWAARKIFMCPNTAELHSALSDRSSRS